ncbi:MAG: hypothetical protein V1725_05375 [archaeon]
MIRMHCHRSLKERVRIYFEEKRTYPAPLERITNFAKNILNISTNEFRINHPNSAYFRKAKNYLEEKGEKDATISLMRSKDTHEIIRGSTRIPLLVKTKDNTYVIKMYDEYDPRREKDVLAVVSGKIAPRVLHQGQEFFSEDYFDHSAYPSLLAELLKTEPFSLQFHKDLWQAQFGFPSDREKAERMTGMVTEAFIPFVRIGARMHADLAKLDVIYDHNHWLDEFRQGKNGGVITDFGTSRFFFQKDQLDHDLKRLHAQYESLKEDVMKGKSTREEKVRWRLVGDELDCVSTMNTIHSEAEQLGMEKFLKRWYLSREQKAHFCEHPALAFNILYACATAEEGIDRCIETSTPCSKFNVDTRKPFEEEFFTHYFS